ncbi:hypothetical protein [Rhodococcus erythropolis]|uniref:hypothetical protein n=1 Tax=Rhodococcus erythropolis TaxID=1833 RepID=UPI002226E33E|nr:hypothetical protein [Rhodococcus erythropolis]MCW2297628.1 hypothetical protein [Rhodococcus erythropolis]
MAESRLTKFELLEKYSSKEWQSKFLRLLSLTSILKGSIISVNYRVPDEVNEAIVLTPYGQQVLNYLIKQEKIGPKEARLQCLLVLSYVDILVDVENTDQEKLVNSIGRQIHDGALRFPYIYGRLLYDKVADSFSEEREYLNVEDTSKLLTETPTGVWQADNIIIGPYGVVVSDVQRTLPPSQRIPLQHCVDPACHVVHKVHLTTSYEAPINRSMYKMEEYLEKGGQEPSDWAGFIEEVSNGRARSFNDSDSSSVPYSLGDLLSIEELRSLLVRMLDTGMARSVRTFLESLGVKGPADKLTGELDHAQLMQLLLIQSDESIISALDEQVKAGEIRVPAGEVRSLKVHHGVRRGVWGLSSELSRYGLRFTSQAPGLSHLRLRRLIHGLYSIDDKEQSSELDWQLRSTRGSSLKGRREEYLRTAPPKDIIRRLVLRDRAKVAQVCMDLQIEWSSELKNDDLINAIMWKLGFRLEVDEEDHRSFWPKHDEMTNLARAANLSTSVDEDRISSGAGVYFKSLEGVLEDSLVYTAWSLCSDHYSSASPFVYDYESARGEVMGVLTKVSAENSAEARDSIRFGENNTLFSLIRGFDLLAQHLDKIRSYFGKPESSRKDLPRYHGKTELKKFPFVHKVLFLDLLPSSQLRLIQDLKEFARLLSSSGICESRNDLLHFRRSTADVEKLTDALEFVRTAVRKAEQVGIVRTLYRLHSKKVDEWGRSTTSLISGGGQVVNFSRPSPYDWLGLPGLEKPQYLFHYAIFEEPNEMFRFLPGRSSEYSAMWSNFPRRPATSGASIAKQSKSTPSGQDFD